MANAGTLFNPDMCDAMVQLIMTDAFWFAMESEHIETIGLQFENIDWLQKQLTIEDMNSLGLFLARIVDAKSPLLINIHKRSLNCLVTWRRKWSWMSTNKR